MMDHAAALADPRWGKKRTHGHVIVRVPDVLDANAFDAVLKKFGAKIERSMPAIHRMVIDVLEHRLHDLVTALSTAGLITEAEPNNAGAGSAGAAIGVAALPNDPYLNQQWYLTDTAVPAAWQLSGGSADILVATVDSGCYAHPDLTNVVPGHNFLTGTSDTTDTGALGGHGTAVAGIVGAVANNGTGIAGAAYCCKIMPLVVLSQQNYAQWSDVAAAVIYAADHGAKIVNVSICGDSDSATLDAAMAYAWGKGCSIFAAAGNNSNDAPVYPAACKYVVSVAATAQDGTLAGFSTFGSWVSVAAPGIPIYTTQSANGYGAWWGTSFACPLTAGIAVLMLAANPNLTNAQVESLIANGHPVAGHAFHKVDALACVQSAIALYVPPPVIPTPPPVPVPVTPPYNPPPIPEPVPVVKPPPVVPPAPAPKPVYTKPQVSILGTSQASGAIVVTVEIVAPQPGVHKIVVSDTAHNLIGSATVSVNVA
jgi:hypothetical protein